MVAGSVPAGSIPACAGEPPVVHRVPSGSWVYPRVCGGTTPAVSVIVLRAGLSPRVRGNRSWRLNVGQRLRSIPACAGEPEVLRSASGTWRVYPRVCGGTVITLPAELYACGLSPRVRGNLRLYVPVQLGRGSIPACAGEPGCRAWRRRWPAVYPRVCGGTNILRTLLPAAVGLSPRVRGNPGARYFPIALKGSIPACAGEPSTLPRYSRAGGVYPRVCGGTRVVSIPPTLCQGLSPRVRGNHGGVKTPSGGSGSIPACAGEPNRLRRCRWRPKVYPRVCGGTTMLLSPPMLGTGLSPRVRGNPRDPVNLRC